MNKIIVCAALSAISISACNNREQEKHINQQNVIAMTTAADFTTTILVDQAPKDVFNAINNVRGWWSEDIEGSTDTLNGEFTYHFKDVHVCRMKLIEFVPDKKVVWQLMDNYFNFTKDSKEWKGNKLVFEITKRDDNKTQLRFTQVGLVPAYECYNICKDAWSNYISNSLRNLITTGKGQPNPKEGGFNQQLLDGYNDQKNQPQQK